MSFRQSNWSRPHSCPPASVFQELRSESFVSIFCNIDLFMLANSHMHLVHVWWSVVLSYHVGLGLGLNLCNQAWQQVLLPADLWPNRSLFTPLMRGRHLTLGGEASAKPQTRRPRKPETVCPFLGHTSSDVKTSWWAPPQPFHHLPILASWGPGP